MIFIFELSTYYYQLSCNHCSAEISMERNVKDRDVTRVLSVVAKLYICQYIKFYHLSIAY